MEENNNLNVESAVSPEEIQRRKAERKKKIKKILKYITVSFVVFLVIFGLSLVDWKGIVDKIKLKKKTHTVIVDESLSHQFSKPDEYDD